jgi:hypothetical protein
MLPLTSMAPPPPPRVASDTCRFCEPLAPLKSQKTKKTTGSASSVAVESGMFIPDPDFYPSRIPDFGSQIPDPKTATKERGEKNLLSYHFLQPQISQNCFIFEMLKKIIWLKNYRTFYPKKLSISSQKYEFGIRDPEKTYSGSRIQGSKRHRIPDPQHCLRVNFHSLP